MSVPLFEAEISQFWPFMAFTVDLDSLVDGRRRAVFHVDFFISTSQKVRVALKKRSTTVPPSLDPVDVTGWVTKLKVVAEEGGVSHFADVTGSISGAAALGVFEYAVDPGAVAAIERGMCEVAYWPGGSFAVPPDIRLQGTATVKVKLL
jgi:hypothetical protein